MTIREAIAEVERTKGLKYIGVPGVIDFLAVHPAIQEDRKTLAEKYGMKAEVTGPPITRDDVRQAKHRIGEKKSQLPLIEPGIIVIFANLLFWGSPATLRTGT